MDEGYFVTLTDEDGNGFQLEHLGEVEYENDTFAVFLPADMDENDPDFGYVILRCVDQGGEEQYESVDDEELLEKVYAIYMEAIFGDEDEEGVREEYRESPG